MHLNPIKESLRKQYSGSRINEELELAKDEFNKADHLLYMTLPLVNEIRLLNSIANGLYKASLLAIHAWINNANEQRYNTFKIEKLDDNTMISFFVKNMKDYIKEDIITTLFELRELCTESKKLQGVEFVMRDKFMLHTSTKTFSIDIAKAKHYAESVKLLISKIEHSLKETQNK